MQLKIISDTHNDHHMMNLGSGDVLIHCGDSCTKGNYTEAENFLLWLVKQPFKYKIVVPGNHDVKLRTHSKLQMLMKDLGIIYLHKKYIKIEGVTFYGNGYTCSTDKKTGRYRDFHFLKRREDEWKTYDKAPDILITHNAPKFILDTNIEGQHVGDDILAQRIQQFSPKYHLFGHVHEHGGKGSRVRDIIFFNCAVKNREYLTVRSSARVVNV